MPTPTEIKKAFFNLSQKEQKEAFEDIAFYLKSHNNGYHDDIWQLFKDLTGLVV